MERIVERPGALDVHKASVTACVRVWDGARARGARGGVPDDRAGSAGAARLAGGARCQAGRDGGHRRVLEAGVGGARGRLRADARQRPAREAGPRPQDRCQGRAVALPAARGRAVEGELRAAQADPHAAEPDPVSQDADQRPPREAAGCTRSSRTPGSSSAVSRPTSSASPAATCSTRSSPARPIPAVLADLARGQAAQEDPGAARGARGPLRHRARADRRPRSSRTSTSSTKRSTGCRPRSRSGSRPFARQRELLMTIPGVKQRTAEVLIAEIGVDMSAFPTAQAPRVVGRRCAPATTSPPANAAPARPAKAPSGSERR